MDARCYITLKIPKSQTFVCSEMLIWIIWHYLLQLVWWGNIFHLSTTFFFRFTYSDLCANIPESKFRQCLLTTLDVLFKLMCSYYAIMSFDPDNNVRKKILKLCFIFKIFGCSWKFRLFDFGVH